MCNVLNGRYAGEHAVIIMTVVLTVRECSEWNE
jgi:hypothetical protein